MEFQRTTSCTRIMNGSQSAMVSPPVSPASPKALVRTKPKRAYRKSKPSANSTPKKRLPADFVPGPDSVICGRGKDCFESEGNKRFRKIINRDLHLYAAAPGKAEKSAIVSKAMDIIRKASPDGSFVKLEKGVWFEVSGRYAREKVGAWFRDCLSSKYRSSSKAKHARKMAKRVSFNALRDDDILNFPLDLEFDLPEISDSFYEDVAKRASNSEDTVATSKTDESEQQTMNASSSSSLSSSSGSFYDIDNMSLSLIPFDVEEV